MTHPSSNASHTEPVTAVLLNWRRPWNMERIVRHLRTLPFITEIIVWDNSGELKLTLPDDEHRNRVSVGVVWRKNNCVTLGRYYAANKARNRVIYTQDDDVLVNNVPALYERFLRDGSKIVAGLGDTDSSQHYRFEAHKKPWLQLGWGSFHRREWFDCIQPYVDRYGYDDVLQRKFDRVYTVMFGRHDPVVADFEVLSNPDGKPSDRDRNALYVRSDHMELTHTATERALELVREREQGGH